MAYCTRPKQHRLSQKCRTKYQSHDWVSSSSYSSSSPFPLLKCKSLWNEGARPWNDLLMCGDLPAVEPLSIGEPLPIGEALLPSLLLWEDLDVCSEPLPHVYLYVRPYQLPCILIRKRNSNVEPKATDFVLLPQLVYSSS